MCESMLRRRDWKSWNRMWWILSTLAYRDQSSLSSCESVDQCTLFTAWIERTDDEL